LRRSEKELNGLADDFREAEGLSVKDEDGGFCGGGLEVGVYVYHVLQEGYGDGGEEDS